MEWLFRFGLRCAELCLKGVIAVFGLAVILWLAAIVLGLAFDLFG